MTVHPLQVKDPRRKKESKKGELFLPVFILLFCQTYLCRRLPLDPRDSVEAMRMTGLCEKIEMREREGHWGRLLNWRGELENPKT